MEYAKKDIVLPHRLLLDAYPDQVRRLMEWALTHREEFTWPQWQWPVNNLGSYVVGTLGAVGGAPVGIETDRSRARYNVTRVALAPADSPAIIN